MQKCGFNYHIRNIPPKKDGICDKCQGELFQRPDDREETVRNRLKVYETQTRPLVITIQERAYSRRFQGISTLSHYLKLSRGYSLKSRHHDSAQER